MAGRQATEAHPSLRETSRSYHDSAVGKIQGPIEGQDRDGPEVIVSRLDLDDVDGVAIMVMTTMMTIMAVAGFDNDGDGWIDGWMDGRMDG